MSAKTFVAAASLVAAFLAAIILLPIFIFAGAGGDESDTASTGTCQTIINVGAGAVTGAQKSTADLGEGWEPNAAVIIGEANRRGLGTQGAVVALATAAQESRLVNINYGDRDSVGLFQQRPSQGWGTVAQIMNPTYAAGKFFDALVKIPGWETMPVTVAAQRVQRSGFPLAYAQWETMARAIVAGSTSGPMVPVGAGEAAAGCAASIDAPVSGDVGGVITALEAYLGLPYSWGGGSLTGPSRGFAQGANTIGFDCSSYVRYGYYKATGITLPRTTRAQYAAASIRITDRSKLQPGDLVFFASNPSNPATIHHVGMVMPGGVMIHAPRTGKVNEKVPNFMASSYWSGQFIGAIRPLADPAFNKGRA